MFLRDSGRLFPTAGAQLSVCLARPPNSSALIGLEDPGAPAIQIVQRDAARFLAELTFSFRFMRAADQAVGSWEAGPLNVRVGPGVDTDTGRRFTLFSIAEISGRPAVAGDHDRLKCGEFHDDGTGREINGQLTVTKWQREAGEAWILGVVEYERRRGGWVL